MPEAPVLRLTGISRTFGATRALRDVSLEFPPGVVTGLLGENGSGKSTLVKILAGLVAPDGNAGTVEVAGNVIGPPLTPEVARQEGLRFLHQDLALVQELTVADNVALADGFLSSASAPVRARAERERTQRLLARFDVNARPDQFVFELSPSEKTMVAVARAFGPSEDTPRVVILDEPTAALPLEDVERVLRAIREATRNGTSVILVSHRLEEVLQITDRIAVLRDGKVVAEQPTAGLGARDLVRLMLGKESGMRSLQAVATVDDGRAAVLSARGIRALRLRGVDLDVYPGEVLGIAGLQGCGRSELARIIAGAQRPVAGELLIDGVSSVGFADPHEALAAGVACVPQDRRAAGVLLDFTLRENLTLGDLRAVSHRLGVSRVAELEETRRLIQRFDIRPDDPDLALRHFSGGNQQKVALARVLRLSPRVLVLDEPTQGIDVGARHQIGEIIRRLCEQGVGVILASSDGDELVDLADRIVVLNRGEVSVTLSRAELTREQFALAVGAGKKAA